MTADRSLEILAAPLRSGAPIVRDYLGGSGLSRFFTGHPGDIAAYARKADEVRRRLDATSRSNVAGAIQPLGDSAARVQRILAGDGFFVTTGQQPALFGGPLYTLHKILSAVRLAALLERQLDAPVVALFWIGSDDHDWEEANHTVALDAQWYAERLAVRGAHDAPLLPMSHRTWGADITRVVADYARLLPQDPYGAEVLAHVRDAYTPGATVAGSFAETMRWLLRDERVAMIDAAHPLVRQAAVPVLLHEVANAAEHGRATAAQTRLLEDAGYSAQVAVAEDASNIMLIDELGRDRLMHGASGWYTRRERRPIPIAELQARIAAEPEQFSPNVFLRPVVESALLPTIAYVAGPGEISYYAQTGCLYRAHGILPPVIVPRASVTLVEPRVRALVERTGITLDDARRPLADLVRERIRREMPLPVQDALAALRRDTTAAYAQLTEHAAQVDPTLRGPLTAARNDAIRRTHDVEKRIITQLRRRNGDLVSQLRKVASSIQPMGAPQERALGPLPFVARHGPGLVADIAAAIDMELAAGPSWEGPACG